MCSRILRLINVNDNAEVDELTSEQVDENTVTDATGTTAKGTTARRK